MNAFSPLRPTDWICITVTTALVLLFGASDNALSEYIAFTTGYPFVAGFVKFAVLGTFGECIAVRIRTDSYPVTGFGLLPRAVIWGLLGVGITLAFAIFSRGVPLAMSGLGMTWAATALAGPFGLSKIVTAFGISVCINLLFAPILMIAHKVGDLHIEEHKGALRCLWTTPDIGALLKRVDWSIMWSFVLARTIPLFWIPVHTLTFLLPETFRILFAACLGAVLGVFLAWKK